MLLHALLPNQEIAHDLIRKVEERLLPHRAKVSRLLSTQHSNIVPHSMANQTHDASFAWLQRQWRNPSDIFTILLIIGGEVVQVAIAQLCAGPVPSLAPVTFSFGWVRTNEDTGQPVDRG